MALIKAGAAKTVGGVHDVRRGPAAVDRQCHPAELLRYPDIRRRHHSLRLAAGRLGTDDHSLPHGAGRQGAAERLRNAG